MTTTNFEPTHFAHPRTWLDDERSASRADAVVPSDTTRQMDVRLGSRGSGKTLVQDAMKAFYDEGEGTPATLLSSKILVIDEVASNPNPNETLGALIIGPRTDDDTTPPWDFDPIDLEGQEG